MPALTANTLTVFVAMKLVSAMNAREHWATRAKRARAQREAVAYAVWSWLIESRVRWRISATPETPKCITLTAHVARKMDTDNLQSSLKAVRDGLQDAGLIHSDGPDSGHAFTYAQVVRTPRGVEITITLNGATT